MVHGGAGAEPPIHKQFVVTTNDVDLPFMSEEEKKDLCRESSAELGDSCEEDEELSEDGSIHDSDDDFVSSDEEDALSGLPDEADWDDAPALVEFVGLRVPRVVLETWARTTLSSLVGLKGSTLNSSLRSHSRLLCALQSHGMLSLEPPGSWSQALLHSSLVLSRPQLLSLPALTQTPSTQPSQATTLSALVTFMASVETRCKASESIAFEISASPSPLETLCSSLALAQVIMVSAREALK